MLWDAYSNKQKQIHVMEQKYSVCNKKTQSHSVSKFNYKIHDYDKP